MACSVVVLLTKLRQAERSPGLELSNSLHQCGAPISSGRVVRNEIGKAFTDPSGITPIGIASPLPREGPAKYCGTNQEKSRRSKPPPSSLPPPESHQPPPPYSLSSPIPARLVTLNGNGPHFSRRGPSGAGVRIRASGFTVGLPV